MKGSNKVAIRKELQNRFFDLLKERAAPNGLTPNSFSAFSIPELEQTINQIKNNAEFTDGGYERPEYIPGKSLHSVYGHKMVDYLKQYGIDLDRPKTLNSMEAIANFFEKKSDKSSVDERGFNFFEIVDDLDKILTRMEKKGYSTELDKQFKGLLKDETIYSVQVKFPFAKDIIERYLSIPKKGVIAPEKDPDTTPQEVIETHYIPVQEGCRLFSVEHEETVLSMIYDERSKDYGIVKEVLPEFVGNKTFLKVEFFKQDTIMMAAKITSEKPEVIKAEMQDDKGLIAKLEHTIVIEGQEIKDILY